MSSLFFSFSPPCVRCIWHDTTCIKEYIYIYTHIKSYVNTCTVLKENEFISALEACKRLVVRLGWGDKLSYDVKCHLFWNKMMDPCKRRKQPQRGKIPRWASKGSSRMVLITRPSTFHIGQHGGCRESRLNNSLLSIQYSKDNLSLIQWWFSESWNIVVQPHGLFKSLIYLTT